MNFRYLYDKSLYWMGKGINHLYELQEINGDKIVIDHATGLTWQQSGSSEQITYQSTPNYINRLNRERFANFDDWRLPTLEEAMSLVEVKAERTVNINQIVTFLTSIGAGQACIGR